MKAKNVISPFILPSDYLSAPEVSSTMPLPEVVRILGSSPAGVLKVVEDGKAIGGLDSRSLLGGIAGAVSDADISYVELECAASDYSASKVAHAVEDADTHLAGLWTVPSDGGKLHVTLRVLRSNPEPIVHSLRRYGFDVTDAYGLSSQEYKFSEEAFAALQLYLNV